MGVPSHETRITGPGRRGTTDKNAPIPGSRLPIPEAFYVSALQFVRPHPVACFAPQKDPFPVRPIGVGRGRGVRPVLLPSGPTEAHEVPANVAVQIYVRPEGSKLRILVRVPLAAMRDVVLPLKGPGYLDFSRLDRQPQEAARLWIADYIRLYENTQELPEETVVATRITLPSDRSFVSYDSALAGVLSPPLSNDTEVMWNQLRLDALLEVPISDENARFSIDPMLAHLGVSTISVLHFVTPDGTERVFQYDSNPGLVRLDPRWYQAAASFVSLGFKHILDGFDHLLFVLCLVVPIRRVRPLVAVITSFTVAHSIT